MCICVGGLSCKVPVPVYLQLTTDWGISSNLQPHDCVSLCVSAPRTWVALSKYQDNDVIYFPHPSWLEFQSCPAPSFLCQAPA